MSYNMDKSLYEKLIKNNKSDIEDCGSVARQPGIQFQCSITYTEEIQNTISISYNNGKSYHKSYEKVYSKGDTTTEDINSSLQLANAISSSKSIHEN